MNEHTEKLNELFINLKKDNILSPHTIGNVTGTIELVKESNIIPEVRESDYIIKTGQEIHDPSNFSFSYTYVAHNGYDMYMGTTYSNDLFPGVYHKDLRTGVITKLYGTSSNWPYFFEDDLGNVYMCGGYNWYGSAYGLICARGNQYKLLSDRTCGLAHYTYDTAGYSYLSNPSSRNATRSLYCVTPYTASSIAGGLYTFTKKDNTVFAYLNYTAEGGTFAIAKLYKGVATQYATELTSVKFIDIDIESKIIRFMGIESKTLYVINYETDEVNSIGLPIAPTNILTSGKDIYVSTGSSSPGLYTLKNNMFVLIPGSEKLYNIKYLATLDGKCYFTSDQSAIKGVYALNNGSITMIPGSENIYYSIVATKDSKDRLYIATGTSSAPGVYILKDGSLVQIATSGYEFSSSYVDTLGRTWFIGRYYMALLNGEQTLICSKRDETLITEISIPERNGIYFVYTNSIVYVSNDGTTTKMMDGTLLYYDDTYLYLIQYGAVSSVDVQNNRVSLGSVNSKSTYYFNENINAYIFTQDNITAEAYLYVLENKLTKKTNGLNYYKMLIGVL